MTALVCAVPDGNGPAEHLVELATAGSDPGRRCFLVGVENGSSGGDDGPPAEQAAADHDGSP